ncbi:MAG: ribosomal protein S18-alanine N-acetyltransferase [bacterium]|nr:ribosomal protein S18-alanine N-acetyltransferase [bacterium]
MKPDGVALEPMEPIHLDGVVALERQVFSNPWTQIDFQSALTHNNAYCRVVTFRGKRVGYAVGFWIAKEFHLADFAIHPEWQRQGLGRQTLAKVCQEVAELARVVSLEVRISNVPAIEMYKQSGFQTMAIRKAYYTNPEEDALVMLKPLEGRLSDWVLKAIHEMPFSREKT